ncbi:hypothetical protein FVEG_05828 [Fusarium verticillioides 7600]|uniref:Uncharacterized protein n=1 Tax=Gibberella moniliformis (strain M3125 / FGSC 7600) TaxID=334819 RepID=W7MIZ0_GIBM7|nr:hypothetical protein FVEG_05828 [Fusarium verticillioides 7600]EWG44857.1 hypothetical protein FVEG_05828 [Fusarium verticillioides 7600]
MSSSKKKSFRQDSFSVETSRFSNINTSLAQNSRHFREPSLRRGYGMAYETPKAFNMI